MSTKVQVDKYFTILGRLRARGELISSDTVALKASNGRGSIKRPRPTYAELIAVVNTTTKQQVEVKVTSDPMPGMRKDIESLTRRLDQSLDKEAALLHKLYDPCARTKQLTEKSRLLKLGRLALMQ